MEYSIWLSWSTSNECIKITVWRPLWNWPLWTMLKNGNFLQCYSYLFFYYPKNAGCFIGNELTSVSAVNLGALSDLLKNRGPKVHININEKLFQVFFFFYVFNLFFTTKSSSFAIFSWTQSVASSKGKKDTSDFKQTMPKVTTTSAVVNRRTRHRWMSTVLQMIGDPNRTWLNNI